MIATRLFLLACLCTVAACDNRTPVPPPKTSSASQQAAAQPPAREASEGQPTFPDLQSDESADQRPANTRERGASALSPVDRVFLAHAAAIGLAEVEAARLALERASDPKVKDFARHMIREHEPMNEQLQAIAADKGIAVVPQAQGKPREHLEQLRGLSGDDFDNRYVKNFGFDAHKNAILLYERQNREGRDAQLKAFAEQALPEERDHEAMAEYLIIAASR